MKHVSAQSRPQAGDVLIASPEMTPNLFARTTVYLHHFDTEGALGLILNRLMPFSLQEMVKGAPLPPLIEKIPVQYGGPVMENQILLTRFTLNPDTHLFTCEWGLDQDMPAGIAGSPHTVIKAFKGHAGWSGGQLEEEIRRGDWQWTSPDAGMLSTIAFSRSWELAVAGDERWKKIRTRMPANPEMN